MSSGQNAILWIRGGHDNGKNIVLSADMTLIGRDPSNHVVVDEIPVSRRHAGIRMDRNGYWLEDFGSRNGTFVNGEEVEGEGRELRNMDRIELGGVSSLQLIFTESGATGTFQVAKELRG
jgi:pSer/pThr/pTyr-binding forkhead associated (FHA) protein